MALPVADRVVGYINGSGVGNVNPSGNSQRKPYQAAARCAVPSVAQLPSSGFAASQRAHREAGMLAAIASLIRALVLAAVCPNAASTPAR
jgi:hypothetical protein